MYTALDVKTLRERTGAGMLDCKKALEENKGNMDAAIDWLREKGISKAAKKESRIAAEGITKIVSNDNTAVIIEVNSETDFVAKNDKFTTAVENIATSLLSSEANTMEEANEVEVNGEKIKDLMVSLTATIGEKLSFRRFTRIKKEKNQVFGTYSHMGGRIGVIVLLNGSNESVAKDVAMHVAAMNPIFLTRDVVPTETLDKEKGIMKEQLINEGKEESKIEKILVGKVNKYYSEVCLEEQIFIKSEEKDSVGKYVKDNGCSIVSMTRYEVGEGIEKRNENFADEVMNQIKK